MLERNTTRDFSKELRLVLVQLLKLDLLIGWILSMWNCKAFNTKFSGCKMYSIDVLAEQLDKETV